MHLFPGVGGLHVSVFKTAVCVTLSGQGSSRCLCVSFVPRPPEPQLEQELWGLRVGSDCTITRAHLFYLTN